MGLILNALQTLYVGAPCVLMAPVAFMQRPLIWLRAIHDYRAEVGCGPNFAYDLCVSRYRADQMQGIDLSGWKLALNGAEPVRAETIGRFTETFAGHGFEPGTMFPAYGMAEATLLISGGRRGAGRDAQRQPRRAAAQAVPRPADAADAQTARRLRPRAVDERIAIVDPDQPHAPAARTWSARSGSAAPMSRAAIGEIRKPRRPRLNAQHRRRG